MSLKKQITTIAIIFACAITFATSAMAHRLNVFAWLENDKVMVECNFGQSRPAAGAVVTILDADTHKQLLTGKTDAQGRFMFVVPSVVREGHGLTIDVDSGQGHHNEWTMDASELYAAASLTAGFDQAAIEGGGQMNQNAQSARPAPQSAAQAGTPEVNLQSPSNIPLPGAQVNGVDHIRSIIHEELEKNLGPIRHQLAAKQAEEPTIVEVIGGIGWLVGLAGIYLYYRSRRKQ